MNYEEAIGTLYQIADEAQFDLHRNRRQYTAARWIEALNVAIGVIRKQQEREWVKCNVLEMAGTRTTQEIIDALRVESPMVFNTLYGDTMKEAADRLEQLQTECKNWAEKRSATIETLQKELEAEREKNKQAKLCNFPERRCCKKMNCKDIVVALRAYRGKSYRALFNAAADTIEALEADLKYTERCDLCDLCVHAQHTPPCAEPNSDIDVGECATCTYDCICKNCRNSDLFEWRGVQKRNGGHNNGI